MFIFFIFCHFFVQFCGLIIDDEKKEAHELHELTRIIKGEEVILIVNC
jgi:hypothetical protein